MISSPLHKRLPLFCLLVATGLLFAAKGAAQQANGGSSEKVTGSITGRVINVNGEPLAGANVAAYQVFRNVRPGVAIADDQGKFKINGLAAGIYSVSASMPGYINPRPNFEAESIEYHHLGDSVTITLIKGGVITGTVTSADGPLVGIGVFAMRVRDAEGRKQNASFGYPGRRTDDRGVFRIYGLPPGTYILGAARASGGFILPSPYDNDAPTFYPSATRDTAAEIELSDGDELTADIRYRADPGHAISGRVAKINGAGGPNVSEPAVTIMDVRNRTAIDGIGLSPGAKSAFAFYGLPDGDYELTARQYLPGSGEELESAPLRVSIRGADVTGLVLSLAPLAWIDGQIIFEADPKLQCGKRKDSLTQETIVWARRYEPKNKAADAKPDDPVSLSSTNHAQTAIVDAKGSFSFRNLPGGSYRIDPRGFADGWYIRSISKNPADSPAARNAVARDGVSVRNGERINGLTVAVTEGAAQVRGRISADEAQTLPPRPAVYLVPSEPNTTENVLKFYEARADATGGFSLNNVAPGNYWIVARPFEESDSFMPPKSIRRDAALRAKVFHEAELIKKTVTLKPCEQVADFNLKYSPAAP